MYARFNEHMQERTGSERKDYLSFSSLGCKIHKNENHSGKGDGKN